MRCKERRFLFLLMELSRGRGPCAIWRGPVDDEGYAIYRTRGSDRLAKDLAYNIFWGSIPEGRRVELRCGEPWCINPFHLKLGPIQGGN